MSKRAIVYIADVILGRTGEIVSREFQKETLEAFARDNQVEIVAWFEDEVYNEDILSRPGIQEMLAYKGEYDCLLVERVWSFSRNWKQLRGFLAECRNRKIELETATLLWDCVSQMSRNSLRERPRELPAVTCQSSSQMQATKATQVSRPKVLRFVRDTN